MIKVRNLSKFFGGQKVLEDISLHVDEGSIYGLIGPNGAGKTTLIKNLMGIYVPEGGDVLISGKNIRENPKIKARMGYVPDFQYIYPNFTLEEILVFYQGIYPGWNKTRCQKLLKLFNLDGRKKLKYLSKGMRAQFSILLGLSIMPQVLILDEPTSGLDPVVKQKVLDLIIDEVGAYKTTVVISSHNLSQLERVCDHIGIIHQGKMLLDVSVEKLKSQVRKIQVAFKDGLPDGILENPNILKVENTGRIYHIVVQDNLDQVIQELGAYNPILLETIDMTLEEIFIYKMGGEGYDLKDIAL